MGLRVETKTIGDSTYRVTQLPYGKARPIMWLAASVLLPAIEALGGVKAVLGGDLLDSVDVGTVGTAFKLFFDRATDAQMTTVEDEFTEQTLVKPPGAKEFVPLKSVRELHWPSRYADLGAWFRFSVEVHFGPFSFASKKDAPAEQPGAPTTP